MLPTSTFMKANRTPQSMIDNANSLSELFQAIQYTVNENLQGGKCTPDICGRLRYCLSVHSKSSDIIDNIRNFLNNVFQITYLKNPSFEKSSIASIVLLREICKIIENQYGILSLLACHWTMGILPIGEKEYSVLSANKEYLSSFVERYRYWIQEICDTYGISGDTDFFMTIAKNLPIDIWYALSSETPIGKIMIPYFEKYHDVYVGENSAFHLDESEWIEVQQTFLKIISYLRDIWIHFSNIGNEILIDIWKANQMYAKEDLIRNIIDKLIASYPDYEEAFADYFLLAKNFVLSINNMQEIRYSNLKNVFYNYMCAFLSLHNNIPMHLFISTIKILYSTILSSEHVWKENQEILQIPFDEAINMLKSCKECVVQDEDPIDILLGTTTISKETKKIPSNAYEYFTAMEARSVNRDDPDSKITSVKKKDRPRNERGQYQSKTADAKSVGLTLMHAFNIFNQNRKSIENQLDKGFNALKDILFGTKKVRTAIVEGKKFSITSLIKSMLGLVALFSFGKVKALMFLIVRAVNRGKIRKNERRKIIMDIEEELVMIDEKINDAAADGDRKAKYSLMRSREELKHALERIRYGYEAKDDSKAIQNYKENMYEEG